MIDLYPHQQQIIEALRRGYRDGHRCQMLALATGGGKTVIASHLIHGAAQKGNRSMFVVDRIELVDQAARHLRQIGLKVGILQGDNTRRRRDDEVVVASIQTIRARGAPPSGFVIIDEAHILHEAHIWLMRTWDKVPFIGLSATPLREDLGEHFTNLVRGPTVSWLTDNGFLVPVRAYCPSAAKLDATLGEVRIQRGDFAESELGTKLNTKELVGDIVSTWFDRGEGRPTLVFAVNIAHSKSIIDDFLAEGVSAAHIDAYTPEDQRREFIDRFRGGDVTVLSSVNVLGIGFDVPDAACGILARPTLSEALHMQQMGRLIRTAPGKADAILLDHAGNTVRYGLPRHFKVPDLNDSVRSAARTKRRQRKLVTCGECGAVIEPDQRVCPSCGIDRPVRDSPVSYIDGCLVEFGEKVEPAMPVDRRAWYAGLKGYAEAKGYKSGWALHKYHDKFGGLPPQAWRWIKPETPSRAMERWIRSQQIRWARRKSA